MKNILFAVIIVVFTIPAFSTITIVDINGAGQFTRIQLAIDNALPGDTIQVWPGTYNEAININKNIILQGSGYENTTITSANNPTITMSNGLLKWFTISSTFGNGISISNGQVKNCVIKGCAENGIIKTEGVNTPYVQNCIILNCGGHGIWVAYDVGLLVCNTIARNNTNVGFYAYSGGWINRSYCNGSAGSGYYGHIDNGQGCIDTDPIFVSSTNYHLSTGSPCYDSGQPSLSDPDGSLSDMGYFGGPDCPIFPVVYQMTVSPNGNNVNVQAKARANY
ncbi:MAG: right-handed parallel beta-helix repeat-containing protein [Bacteroidota bacterium]